MRVALVGPIYPYRGGIAKFNERIALELEADGHLISVFSFARQYPAWLYPGKTDKDPSAQHEDVKASYLLDPLYVWTWVKVARDIEAFQPDIVVIQWWTTFWAPAYFFLVSALQRKRVCVFCIHNVLPHEQRFFDAWAARQTLSKAHACITLSSTEEERLRRLNPSVKNYLLRLAAFDPIQPPIETSAARQILGLPQDGAILLFFGLVRKYKGVDVLLEALSILKSKGICPLMLISGEFWDDVQDYQKRIHSLGLDEQIIIDNRFIPTEEMPALFSAADGFVAPHIGGSQSGAIKLAMSYGLPVLASSAIAADLPADRHPIDVHEAGNAVSLANSIETFLSKKKKGKTPLSPAQDGKKFIALLQNLQEKGRKS